MAAQTPARRVRYQVAASLDGYVAGPNGEADWIPMDPDIDFSALFAQFDTLLMGRRTFQATVPQGKKGKKAKGGGGGAFGMTTIVFSRTLNPADYPSVQIVSDDAAAAIARLKATPGKDLWLFGGGDLFRSLASRGLVDRVEIALVPIMLGGGIPLFPASTSRVPLKLDKQRTYEKSGIVLLEYQVVT
jgi:dihydrofolate reductase